MCVISYWHLYKIDFPAICDRIYFILRLQTLQASWLLIENLKIEQSEQIFCLHYTFFALFCLCYYYYQKY